MKLIMTNWMTAYDVSQHQSIRINHPLEVQHELSPRLSGIYAFRVFTSIPLHLHKHHCICIWFGWLFDVGHSSSIAKPEMLFFRFSILFMSLSFCPTFHQDKLIFFLSRIASGPVNGDTLQALGSQTLVRISARGLIEARTQVRHSPGSAHYVGIYCNLTAGWLRV